jgi:membrane protein DedA with SNARE-associated domain
VGLPIPDETLLTFTGYLVYKNQLSAPLAFACSLAGSASGITISYTLGRTFGMRLLERYGKYIHLTQERIEHTHAWFDRIGHWALAVGYFIPGVRHLTAYAAGISSVPPRQFALFAYSGAIVWVSCFLSLGYFLGERWQAVQRNIDHYLLIASIGVAVIVLVYLIWLKWIRQR